MKYLVRYKEDVYEKRFLYKRKGETDIINEKQYEKYFKKVEVIKIIEKKVFYK